jgi:hypothetical protein
MKNQNNDREVEVTAEEFIREKIRDIEEIKGQMYGLWNYSVSGEQCLRWAQEYATLQLSKLSAELEAAKQQLEALQVVAEKMADAIQSFINFEPGCYTRFCQLKLDYEQFKSKG